MIGAAQDMFIGREDAILRAHFTRREKAREGRMSEYNQVTADKIIAAAVACLGQGESPPGSNLGPLPDEGYRFVHGAESNPADDSVEDREWCAEVACLFVYRAGITDGPRTASSGALVAWGRAHNRIVTDPRRGDIACEKGATVTGYKHTVLVEHNDGMIHSIGGNESNRVKRNTYALDAMTYVRPYP